MLNISVLGPSGMKSSNSYDVIIQCQESSYLKINPRIIVDTGIGNNSAVSYMDFPPYFILNNCFCVSPCKNFLLAITLLFLNT